MATIKIYPEGIFVFPKHKNAPDFVIGKVTIDIDKFNEWINSHEGYLSEFKGRSQLKLDLLKGKEDKLYFTVDNYVPAAHTPEDLMNDNF